MGKLKKFQFKTWHFGLLFITLLVLTNILDATTINNAIQIRDSNLVELSDKTFDDAISSTGLSLVFLYKKNCRLCNKMESNLNQLENNSNTSIKLYKLDIEEYSQKYNEHHISGTPTVLIYKNGKEIERVLGVVPVSNLTIIYNRIKK